MALIGVLTPTNPFVYDGTGNIVAVTSPTGEVGYVLSKAGIAALPTTLPASPGLPWNNGGMIAIS